MKKAYFNAVCPYEIGDRISITMKDGKKEEKVITDICAAHFMRNQNVIFSFQFDNEPNYYALDDPVDVKINKQQFMSKVVQFKKKAGEDDD